MQDLLFNTQPIVLGLTLSVMAVGIIFTLIPPLPGSVIVWAAAAFYGLTLGWDEHLGWPTFIGLTIFMLIGVVLDIVAGHFGAKIGGASWLAIIIGLILGVVLSIAVTLLGLGNPILGCFAGIIGMILGIFIIEWWRNGERDKAFQAIKGYCAGTVLGNLAKFVTSLAMVGLFLMRVYDYW